MAHASSLIVLALGLVGLASCGSRSDATSHQAQCVKAKRIADVIGQAINNFRSDYGRWPLPTGSGSDSDYSGLSNQAFLVHLLGKDLSKNKRGRNFLDTLPIAKNGVGGLVYEGNGAAADLIDPWGKEFTIIIDADNDGNIANPELGSASGMTSPLKIKVGVLSSGADKMLSGTNGAGVDAAMDNIRSW